MSAREFYELVVRMRAAQKLAGMTVKYEDIQLAYDYEKKGRRRDRSRNTNTQPTTTATT